MASKIEWTDQTWNPIVGCSKVSPGCDHCYAERMGNRLAAMNTKGYQNVIEGYWDGHAHVCEGWNGNTNLIESALEKPLHWRKPRMIFVCSMGDLFHESVPFEWIDKVFAVMALCPQHTFQLLTKRPERMLEYITREFRGVRTSPPMVESAGKKMLTENMLLMKYWKDFIWLDVNTSYTLAWPLFNVWLGVTAENQQRADERRGDMKKLHDMGWVTFTSVEPMLGEVNMHLDDNWTDWVICGGESGPGARPMKPDWARGLRDQCKEAGVPFMFKQWGKYLPRYQEQSMDENTWRHIDENRIGPKSFCRFGSFKAWPVGKKKAGRLLDGVEHNGFPEKAEQ